MTIELTKVEDSWFGRRAELNDFTTDKCTLYTSHLFCAPISSDSLTKFGRFHQLWSLTVHNTYEFYQPHLSSINLSLIPLENKGHAKEEVEEEEKEKKKMEKGRK
ncbi:hypothetical protein KIN20_037505 [Parelaphostrongylus tenuis]|uniref:Uncharacterized protein n=1 Tax=Parelaphostrongylus tenuis TaxID=148309 RepID=A0AAD5RI23_PARTN|nr:hypothetical protein KIN20_037505 [Parelaphostrongylus tenuis]